jgi:hypothetical protein
MDRVDLEHQNIRALGGDMGNHITKPEASQSEHSELLVLQDRNDRSVRESRKMT